MRDGHGRLFVIITPKSGNTNDVLKMMLSNKKLMIWVTTVKILTTKHQQNISENSVSYTIYMKQQKRTCTAFSSSFLLLFGNFLWSQNLKGCPEKNKIHQTVRLNCV